MGRIVLNVLLGVLGAALGLPRAGRAFAQVNTRGCSEASQGVYWWPAWSHAT